MMATKQNKSSVIAKLMGFDEMPTNQRHVYIQQRVLSEDYLQKSVSITKRSSKSRQKKANATINDSSKDVSLRYVKQRTRSFGDKQRLRSTIVKGIEERNDLPEKIVVLRSNLGDVKHGWEFKKQLLESSKRTKVSQEIWSRRRVVQAPFLLDFESKQRSKLGTQVVISSNEGWKDKSVTKLPALKRINFSSKLKKMSKSEFSLRSNNKIPTNSEQIAYSDSVKEGCFPYSLDELCEQDSPCEDELMDFSCIDIDDELPKSTGEVYQPSPNSVLEPDNSSTSEYDDSVSTDLDGLWMKLQILKSESEEKQSKPEIITSSDEDATDQSSLSTCQNTKPFRSYSPKESREFSYLVEFLNEFGFLGGKMEINFETLEKKYEKQQVWKKADRQLLFDRINSGLLEISKPQLDFIVFSKPLKRKMGPVLRRDIVEEEVWNMLVAQEKEVNASLPEKAVGKEPWLELVDEVDCIVVEIEAFLFDKLVTEFVAF